MLSVMMPFSTRLDLSRRFEPAGGGVPPVLVHPLPKRLLPEARGCRVTRLRATLRRPPAMKPSLS